MKKILIVLSVLFLMSGCDNGTENLSCTSTSTANGVTTKTTYDIKYKNDDVKHVTITYDYNQDTTNTNNDNNNPDGTNADTDGLDQNTNTDRNDGKLESDDVVDGVVGDTIDGAVDGVTNTILDLAGIKNTYENQLKSYDNIEGFSYKVDVDSDNEYKVIYEIDLDKIKDDDLTRFDINRNFSDTKKNYEDLGYTCN